MFKLCKTCGYINKGNAIECEECYSLLDIDISDISENASNKTKKDNKKISISSIFRPKKGLVNPGKEQADEELIIDKIYYNDYEIDIEGNDIIMEETPKPVLSKNEPVKEIKEKPVSEVKQEDVFVNIEKEILQKDIKVDDNTVSEIEPDESTIPEMIVDNDTYNEIPIEDNSEEIFSKEEKNKQEKNNEENLKEKQEEDKIKKAVSETLREVLLQSAENDGEEIRIRRRI